MILNSLIFLYKILSRAKTLQIKMISAGGSTSCNHPSEMFWNEGVRGSNTIQNNTLHLRSKLLVKGPTCKHLTSKHIRLEHGQGMFLLDVFPGNIVPLDKRVFTG